MAPMDGILTHGNRYLFMVVFHPSHGQTSTSRMYFAMDILPPWDGTYDEGYLLSSGTYAAVITFSHIVISL